MDEERHHEHGHQQLEQVREAHYNPRYDYLAHPPRERPLGPPFEARRIRDIIRFHKISMEEDDIELASVNRKVEYAFNPTQYGNTVIPKEKTLWGYKYALRQNDGENGIQFNPAVYGLFDGIIVQKCGFDEHGRATNPAFNDGDYYNQFAPLRRNIALLRNYLMEQYPPKNKENLIKLQQMAQQLGDALAGTPPPAPFRLWHTLKGLLPGRSISEPYVSDFMKAANTPDRGAAMMYEYLYKQQNKTDFNSGLKGKPEWELKHLEETPFNGPNMRMYSGAARMQLVVDAFDNVVGHLRSLDTLHTREKRISVEEAHKILENLRLEMANGQDEKRIDLLDPKIKESQALLQAAIAYRGAVTTIINQNPGMLSDPMLNLKGTLVTLEKIDYRLKVEQQRMLSVGGWPSHARGMGAQAARTPRNFKNNEPIEKLIDELDDGLLRAGAVEQRASASPSRTAASAPPQARAQAAPQQQASRALNQHTQMRQNRTDRKQRAERKQPSAVSTNTASRNAGSGSGTTTTTNTARPNPQTNFNNPNNPNNPFRPVNPYRNFSAQHHEEEHHEEGSHFFPGRPKRAKTTNATTTPHGEEPHPHYPQHEEAMHAVQGGLDMMSSPKISQINHPDYVPLAQEANREKEQIAKDDINGGPNLGGGARR